MKLNQVKIEEYNKEDIKNASKEVFLNFKAGLNGLLLFWCSFVLELENRTSFFHDSLPFGKRKLW